jgi:3-dehydroquinate synthase
LETESLESEKPLTHGEAVGIGMMVETILSYENELISKEEMDEVFGALLKVYGKNPIDENVIDSLLFWMENDKKNSNEKMNFSLIHNIGDCKYNVLLNENQVIQGILKYNHKIETFPA